jgi:phenylglyoxylate dehydrogenase beta subunit
LKGFYDILHRKFNVCPPDCSICEEKCSRSGIKSVHLPKQQFHGVLTCVQCGEPKCIEACPSGALKKDEADGVIRISEEKCFGCGICSLACRFGGIYIDSKKRKALKCDTCNGKFECVEYCRYDVLKVFRSKPIRDLFQEEEILVSGVPVCAGCPMEIGLRTMLRVFGKETIVFTAPGCAASAITAKGFQPTMKVSTYGCLMTNVPSSMTGVKRYFQRIGKNVNCVAFVGDGCTSDVGFQPLSGAAERGENIIYICYDNEAYMNTGIQRSSTTPLGAWTTTTPVGKWGGKRVGPKDMPMLMVWHKVPYVATATVSHLEDYVRKLTKAKSVKDGMAYIHLLAPCPIGWRAPFEEALELSRMAVETNYFPLWEAEHGQIRITHEVKNPKPIKSFIRMMGRFSHLKDKEIQSFQKMVDERLGMLKGLARLSKKQKVIR